MTTMYVLTENDGAQSVLGVFDDPDITNEKLGEYYGPFEVIKTMDVRDSGVVWMKTIKWRDEILKTDREIILSLNSYVVGEI